MKRRAFIGLLAAAPVAARNSAQKAGVSAFEYPENHLPTGATQSCGPTTYNKAWALSKVAELREQDTTEEIQFYALPTRLDPDLASMRSFSLSAAMRLQRDRDIKRAQRMKLEMWSSEFRAALGPTWRTILGVL